METIDDDNWDFWRTSGLTCSGYDSDIDLDLINVFKETAKDSHWFKDIAINLNLNEKYVCLLIEILCSANFCEYGTSPRSAWAIKSEYEENLNKLENWYLQKWNQT